MRVVILSGGAVEDAFALAWLQENKYDMLIAADSGMNFLYRNGIQPNLIAGDFDSADREAYEYFKNRGDVEIISLNPMKDDTDTEFVIREAVDRGATEITLLGATGTRLDHVLSNISLLGIGLKEKVSMELLDAHNRIRIIDRTITLTKDEQFGKYVSLLPFGGSAKGVTLEGFQYPLTNYTLDNVSSLGISNEIVAEKATVHVTEGMLLVIESRD